MATTDPFDGQFQALGYGSTAEIRAEIQKIQEALVRLGAGEIAGYEAADPALYAYALASVAGLVMGAMVEEEVQGINAPKLLAQAISVNHDHGRSMRRARKRLKADPDDTSSSWGDAHAKPDWTVLV